MEYTIAKEFASQRVDKFVRRILNEAPLSFIYKLFRQKDIKVNGKKVAIDYKLVEGDIVFIYIKEDLLAEMKKPNILKPVKANFEIIYEDDNILIANKDKGILVHGDENEKRLTMENIFLNYLSKKGEYHPNNAMGYVPGPAHRLDRNTSGILVFSKNLMATQELLKFFREKVQIKKEYVALVSGTLKGKGRIDFPLIKDNDEGIVRVGRIDKGAKNALTLYEVVRNFRDFTLVKATLVTGRTHQLRVHFQTIEHPIVGDTKYGNFKVNKFFDNEFSLKSQLLHAESIEFMEVEGPLSYLSHKKFIAEMPEKEANILKNLS